MDFKIMTINTNNAKRGSIPADKQNFAPEIAASFLQKVSNHGRDKWQTDNVICTSMDKNEILSLQKKCDNTSELTKKVFSEMLSHFF